MDIPGQPLALVIPLATPRQGSPLRLPHPRVRQRRLPQLAPPSDFDLVLKAVPRSAISHLKATFRSPVATFRSPVGNTAPHRGTAGATEPRPARYQACGHGHPRIGFQMSRCLMLALHACRWLTWCCMGRRRTLHYGITWHRSPTPAAVVDFLRRSMVLNGDLLQTCGDVRRKTSLESISGSRGH